MDSTIHSYKMSRRSLHWFFSTPLQSFNGLLWWLRQLSLPAVQETRVQSLGREAPLEKEMATHCSILAWKIPWMEVSLPVLSPVPGISVPPSPIQAVQVLQRQFHHYDLRALLPQISNRHELLPPEYISAALFKIHHAALASSLSGHIYLFQSQI